MLGALEVDFEVQDPPELAQELLRVADRFRRATAPTAPLPGTDGR